MSRLPGAVALEGTIGTLMTRESPGFRTRPERTTERLWADSSTTSLNLQPSLVTPLEVMGRAVAILDEAITAVLAGKA